MNKDPEISKMIGIPRPEHILFNEEERTTRLFFPNDHNSTFHLRGGICWPGQIEGYKEGFVCLLGQDLFNGKTYVFEEKDFLVVDHHIGHDGRIQFEGISQWFNNNFYKYFADTYYENCTQETKRKYGLQIIRSIMINPKPVFPDVQWAEDYLALNAIWEQGNLGKLFYRSGGLIDSNMKIVNSMPKPEIVHPSIHAFACAVWGMQERPYRKYAE